MAQGSWCPYCRRKYNSSTWYRNHIQSEHSGFVQSWSTLQQPICDEARSEQIQLPAADFDLTSNLRDEELGTIKLYTGENELNQEEPEVDSDL